MRAIKTGLPEVLFEVGAIEYGVTAAGYYPGHSATYEDPGDGPEVDMPNVITIYANGVRVGETTWSIFILDYASQSVPPNEQAAERLVYDKVLEETDEHVVSSYDGPEYEKEDDDYDRFSDGRDDDGNYEY
jgi:hypothetical protein